MKAISAWLKGGNDRQLADGSYADRDRVFRDGDAAGTEPRRRRFGST